MIITRDYPQPAVCPVCTVEHFTTGSIVPHPTVEDPPHPGWAMCEAHAKLANEGYIAVVEVEASDTTVNNRMDATTVTRLGRIAHIMRPLLEKLFGATLDAHELIVFIGSDTMTELEEFKNEMQELKDPNARVTH